MKDYMLSALHKNIMLLKGYIVHSGYIALPGGIEEECKSTKRLMQVTSNPTYGQSVQSLEHICCPSCNL
jgi:hypothetical protein